jgi:hypothetical protein
VHVAWTLLHLLHGGDWGVACCRSLGAALLVEHVELCRPGQDLEKAWYGHSSTSATTFPWVAMPLVSLGGSYYADSR